MDKMCNKSELDDLNQIILSGDDASVNSKESLRCESPVFRCFNQNKSNRPVRSDSSDYEIPSYQINRSAKNKTADSEISDAILPFTPIFSPVPVSSVQFQPPSIHSLGTVKRMNVNKTIVNTQCDENNAVKSTQNIFESLGMTDKDISWVSSMASPPPIQPPRSGFNTIEKSTFFPEEKFQNIQPRALFSPTCDDDFGFKPLTFSSESEDDDSYKTNIRLSDVCATLKQLEVKSLDQSESRTLSQESSSPVIRTKKIKSENVKNKKKGILIKSPEPTNSYEFLVSKSVEKATKSDISSGSSIKSFFEDDSFHSISFSGIDELCKTLINTTEQSDSKCSAVNHETTITNSSVYVKSVSKKNLTPKHFYTSKMGGDVFKVDCLDNVHSYAKALEEVDVDVVKGGEIEKSFLDKGIVRFDALDVDFKKDATKRLHSHLSEAKSESTEKRFKSDDSCNWEEAKKYLSESQLNVSDGEMYRTVEKLEKTLLSQEAKELNKIKMDEIGDNGKMSAVEVTERIKTEVDKVTSENTSIKNLQLSSECILQNVGNATSDLCQNFSVGFATASESKLSVSEEAMLKAKKVFKDCEENSGCSFEGFSTCSGKKVKVSSEALKKAEAMMSECEENSFRGFPNRTEKKIQVSLEALDKAKAMMSKCEEALEVKSRIKVSPEALEKAKSLMSGGSCNFKKVSKIQVSPESLEKGKDLMLKNFPVPPGKTIKVSPEALEKAKALVSETATPHEKIFTVPGKRVEVSSKALEKAKALILECEESVQGEIDEKTISNFNSSEVNWMGGFSTGTGRKIKVSAEALSKAKVLMADCEDNLSEIVKGSEKSNSLIHSGEVFKKVSSVGYEKLTSAISSESSGVKTKSSFMGFCTGLGKPVKVSEESLEKAKALMSEENMVNVNGKKAETSTESECFSSLKKKEVLNLKPASSSKSIFKGFPVGCKISAEAFMSEDNLDWIDDKSNNCFQATVENRKSCENNFLGFTTGLGKQIKVSSEALEKAKTLLSEENIKELGDQPNNNEKNMTSTSNANQSLGFASNSRPIATVPEVDLAESKKLQSNLEKKNEAEKLRKIEQHTNLSSISGITDSELIEGDWDEIIPNWLLTPTVEKTTREQVAKSPVLGSSDRYNKKTKRRKLLFEEKKTCGSESNIIKGRGKRSSSELSPRDSLKRLKSSTAFSAERDQAREQQEKEVKEKQKVRPMKGSHLSKKSSEKQMEWVDAVEGNSPEVYSYEELRSMNVQDEVIRISINNALDFRFTITDSSLRDNSKSTGYQMGDSCFVIPDDEDKAGVSELKRSFLASPGVQPDLVPEGWVENHYKWIVWKLAHYEKSFPKYFGGRCLTPHNVLLQMKYRYDREIDRSERSALKKILERDDAAAKRMILCVHGLKKIITGDVIDYEISLTDGWYSCPARGDPAMVKLIENNKLTVGTKVMTQGAALLNCEHGVSPLELKGDVFLKISTNSTRRVKWDTKLGFAKNPENFAISLGSILPQGGPISRLDVIIVRIYPVLYMEKTPDGRHVTRNLRSEEKAKTEYLKIQEKRIEAIQNEIRSEMMKASVKKRQSKGRVTKSNIPDIEQAEDLCQLMESCSDPSVVEELMSSDQKQLLKSFHLKENDRLSREFSEKLEEKLTKEKLSKRNVSELLRMKIVDLKKPDYNNPAVLTVWNPNEELIRLFSEGKGMTLTNLTIGTSSRSYKPMQINTTRQTQYKQIVRSIKYPARQVTRLGNLSSKICPVFEEVDIVGVVMRIQDVSHGSRLSQVVYLTDLEFNFVGIVFWGSCKDYGWENVLAIRSLIACSNLQWKKNYCFQEVPTLHVHENTVFTENPKHGHLKEELERLKLKFTDDLTNFLSKCDEELTLKLEDSKWRANLSRNSSANDSKLRLPNEFESKPTASSTPIKPFSSTVSFDEAEPSPIQKKIEKLQSYGEPPPLIPLIVSNNLRRVKRK